MLLFQTIYLVTRLKDFKTIKLLPISNDKVISIDEIRESINKFFKILGASTLCKTGHKDFSFSTLLIF